MQNTRTDILSVFEEWNEKTKEIERRYEKGEDVAELFKEIDREYTHKLFEMGVKKTN